MFSPPLEIEIILPQITFDKDAFVTEAESRLNGMAQQHGDFRRATVTLKDTSDDGSLFVAEITGSVGAAELSAKNEGPTPLAALERTVFEFEEKLNSYRDILPGDIENPQTDSLPQEVLELTVNSEGEMVSEIDEALRREDIEHYDNVAERLAHADEIPENTY